MTFQWHACGESRSLDADGNLIEVGTAPTTDMSFFNLRRNQTTDPEGGVINDSDNPNLVQIDVSGSGRVPFSVAPYVPSIDYVGTLSFDPDSLVARFRGGINGFPSYEIYATADNGAPTQVGAFAASSPFDLIGDAQTHVDVSATVIQGCVLANPVFERIAHPSVDADGRRATASAVSGCTAWRGGSCRCRTANWWRRIKISAVFHPSSRRASRSRAVSRMGQ